MLLRWELVGKLIWVVWRVVRVLGNPRVGVGIHRLEVGIVGVNGWQEDIWTGRGFWQIWLVRGRVLELCLIVRPACTLLSRALRSK